MEIKKILEEVKTIAVVGLSDNPDRDSYIVAKYLQEHGYKIIPVNPNIKEWNGIKSYLDMMSIPSNIKIDIVDIFRKSEFVTEIVKEATALKKKPKLIWMQLGIENKEAKELAEKNGIEVIQNRCIKIEHQKLVD